MITVNDNCVCCLQCSDVAPDFFEVKPDTVKYWTGKMRIVKQPKGKRQNEMFEKIIRDCPVAAIEREK